MKESFLKPGKPTLPIFFRVISEFFRIAAPKNTQTTACYVSEVAIKSNFFFIKTHLKVQ